MFYSIILYLQSIKRNFLLLIFIIPFSVYAMEQSIKVSGFDGVPQEIKQKVVLSSIPVCKNLKEIISYLQALKSVNWEWHAAIEDQQLMVPFIEGLHKKFNLRELDAHYLLHTKAAQEKLFERIQIITKYAFLHHNDLLHKNGGPKNLRVGPPLTVHALEHSYQALHQEKKDNSNPLNISKEIDSITRGVDPIDIAVDAYTEKIEGHAVAAYLLYLSEHTDKTLKDIQLKDYLRNNNLFLSMYSQVLGTFYPNSRKKSEICTTMFNRINPVGK